MRFIFLYALVFIGFLRTECLSENANQGEQSKISPPDSMETQCLNRVNEFLKWYTVFSIKDDKMRHVLKNVSKHAQRIDTLGARAEVNRYYRSGFLTKSWKENAIKDILAGDTILARLHTDDEIWMGGNSVPYGVIGDPVLGLMGHENWFMGRGYKWEVNGFERLKEGGFSVNLFLHIDNNQVNKWVIHLLIENGQLKFSWVSNIIDAR